MAVELSGVKVRSKRNSGATTTIMPPQDDLFIEPANADDYETVYGDFNDTMASGSADRPVGRPYIRLNSILPNSTKNEGEAIRLRCEAAGSPLPIKFLWYKNHAPLEKKKGRKWQVKNREYWSRLRISELGVLDSGYYKCVASNSAGSVETTAVIKVKPGVKRRKGDPPIDDGDSSNHRRLGLDEDNDDWIEGSHVNHEVYGDWLNGGGDPNRPETSGLVEGSCQEYKGEACKEFLTGQRVLITTSNIEEIRDNERQLKAAMMFISNSSDISAKCKRYSHAVACYHGYQVCDPQPDPLSRSAASGGDPPTLQLCQNDCVTLQDQLCPEEYRQAEQHHLIGPGKLLPNCDVLQSRSSRCIPVLDESDSQHAVNPTHWCYVGSGKSYRGTASRTVSGKACMEWSAASEHYTAAAGFNEMAQSGNFCRNPGGHRPRPWCYAAPDGQEEYCQLDECPKGMFPHLVKEEAVVPTVGVNKNGDVNKRPPTGDGSLGSFWHSLAPHWQYSVIAGAGALLLLMLIAFLCCWCRKGKKRRSRGDKSSINGTLLTNGYGGRKINGVNGSYHTENGHNAALEMSSLLPPPPPNRSPPSAPGMGYMGSDLPPEIPPSSLRLMDLMGDGQFGKVWTGQLLGYENGNEEPMQVVVKTLKEEALPRQQKDFQQEAAVLSSFRHQNVVEMVGVCFNASPQCVVFEYMIHGDLHKFLLLRSPYSQPVDQTVDRERLMLDHSDFIHISTQIAAGMEYLSSCHYVHRDLATRNCLVTDRLVIKISDFGVMRQDYVGDYYPMQTKSLMPIRWMPPEAILYGRFSEESDVWAYGVTVWEIYSYGTQPYYGYSNTEVIELIRTRCLLECPDNCPSRMYSLMIECWHEASGRRPKFSELHGRLQTWSVMSSPAQSSALSGHHPNLPHGPQPTRSGSVHSGASNGRISRQSSSIQSSTCMANGALPAANSVASSVPRHSSPYGGMSQTQMQTIVTMNGIMPFSQAAYQQQAAMNKNSPSLASRNRAMLATAGAAYYGSGHSVNGSNGRGHMGAQHGNQSFDLDSSTSVS